MTSPLDTLRIAQAIYADVSTGLMPPEEGAYASKQLVIPASVVRGTRGYIENVSNQVNGTFENGWYDACAVMIRRLLETLIIEVFEHHKIADRIRNSSGEFFYLRDLIDQCLNEATWNLSRNSKSALRKLKDMGDKSAHSRRYNAHLQDVLPLVPDIRTVVQELIYLAGFK